MLEKFQVHRTIMPGYECVPLLDIWLAGKTQHWAVPSDCEWLCGTVRTISHAGGLNVLRRHFFLCFQRQRMTWDTISINYSNQIILFKNSWLIGYSVFCSSYDYSFQVKGSVAVFKMIWVISNKPTCHLITNETPLNETCKIKNNFFFIQNYQRGKNK